MAPRPRAATSSLRLLVILLTGIAGAAAIVGGYWLFRIKPRIDAIEGGTAPEPGRVARLKKIASSPSGFDLSYSLPVSPQGLAWNGKDLIIGARKGGALRVRRSGDRLEGQTVPLREPLYDQNIGLYTLTWAGDRFVGYTTGSWVQKQADVFTVHDATTLALVSHAAAPPLIGCIAWDGKFLWGGTRRNTADSPEPSLLYKFDRDFNIVSTTPAPGVGCQGMAWDGRYLWMVDVFSDAIAVIDPTSDPPRVVHSEPTALQYLSGIVEIDDDIWVTEYGDDRLHRLAPAKRLAWAGGRQPMARVAASVMGASVAAATTTGGVDESELRRALRAEHWGERMRAEMELRRRGAMIDFDRDQESSPERQVDDTEVLDWQVELRDEAVYGSWIIWFGPELFRDREQKSTLVTIPKFSRYEVTIELPSGQKVKRKFQAVAGENVMRDVRLSDAAALGTYEASLFLHVQYVDAEGTGRILNRSGAMLELRR